jgi:hypothetical protein
MKAKWNYNITHYENTQSSYILNIFFNFTTSDSNKTKSILLKRFTQGRGRNIKLGKIVQILLQKLLSVVLQCKIATAHLFK